MRLNFCTKCGTAINALGKCPKCDVVDDINISREESTAQGSEANTSNSCCSYGCLIPIVLVILTVTCSKGQKPNSPMPQKSASPQFSEPSSVQQPPPVPEPEPPRTPQIRPSATHTNDPVCRACGMNHNYVAQPLRSPFQGFGESRSPTSGSNSNRSGDSNLWTTMKAREELELAKIEIKGIYDQLGPAAALQPYSDFKEKARSHGWTVEGGDTFGSWSDFEPHYK